MNARAEAIGGRTLAGATWVLVALVSLAVAVVAWRFASGLGATTALNDGYPWGIWIAYDVVTGTAIASGGYAMALLVYVLNEGRFHPLVRPALLAGALGYTLAGVTIVFDIGRYWNLWKIFVPGYWNLSSILLEVALCVMAYTVVLWLELSPALVEKWRASDRRPGLRRFAERIHPYLGRAMVLILALGVLLPTMHQSSLGSLMMIAGHKVHGLWQSPMLPLLFLLTCVPMGYSMVSLEASVTHLALRRPREGKLLATLGVITAGFIFTYLLLRFIDLALRGRLALTLVPGRHALLFWIEIALFLAPALAMLSSRFRARAGNQFRAAMAFLLGGALYRFDVYLIAYDPGPSWSYFPSVPEIAVTAGVIAAEILVYIAIVRKVPILSGAASRAGRK